MVEFRFRVNKSFLNYPHHPITILKRVYTDLEREELASAHSTVIEWEDGTRDPGHIYEGIGGYGHYCQIQFRTKYDDRDPVSSLAIGDWILVTVSREDNVVRVILRRIELPSGQRKSARGA